MALRTLLYAIWASPVAALAHTQPQLYPRAEFEPVDGSMIHDIFSFNSRKFIDESVFDDGEHHGPIKPPKGSVFTSIPINTCGKEELAMYISEDYDAETIERVYISVHGRLRNGNRYWRIMNDVINDAQDSNIPGTDHNMLVVAPQFFSEVYNSGQYTENQLAWADLNAWQAGVRATLPRGTEFSALDALDGLVRWFSDEEKYPKLRNLTFVGHGGGGQLVQRYTAVGQEPPPHLHVRYIHGDASSAAYFTDDRPILTEEGSPTKEECVFYNTWRYGFDGFPASPGSVMTVKDYFKQYITRDVISLVGYNDTDNAGDQRCMAQMQGGRKRRDRNLIWYQYVSMLARTGEDLDGFPGEFESVPDWSDVSNHSMSLRLVVVDGVGHDLEGIFKDDNARKALFSKEPDVAWNPKDFESID